MLLTKVKILGTEHDLLKRGRTGVQTVFSSLLAVKSNSVHVLSEGAGVRIYIPIVDM